MNSAYAFYSACLNNQLEIAKWVLESTPNINMDYDHIFRKVCEKGYLEIAKWLVEIKPNIDCEAAFHCAYGNHHFKVVKWLLKINPLINVSNI